jgi:hypothetical protein
VVRSTTGNKYDAPAAPYDTEICLESTKRDLVRVKVDATSHRVDNGFRLLVNLLLHEMVKGALHDRRELDLEGLDGSDGRNTVTTAQTVNVEFALGNVSNVIVLSRRPSERVATNDRRI